MGIAADIAMFKAKLDSAIDDTMQGPVLDGAKKQISETALDVVYKYPPQFESRRKTGGGVADPGNLYGAYGDKELTIFNETPWQHLYKGAYPGEELVDALAAGSARYHFQSAGSRKFMEKAEKEFKPEFERLIASGLRAHGFIVH